MAKSLPKKKIKMDLVLHCKLAKGGYLYSYESKRHKVYLTMVREDRDSDIVRAWTCEKLKHEGDYIGFDSYGDLRKAYEELVK